MARISGGNTQEIYEGGAGGYNFTYEPKSDGGYNFWIDGRAVPREEYLSYGGKIFDVQAKADGGYDYYVNGEMASQADYVGDGGQIPGAVSSPEVDQTIAPTTPPTTDGTVAPGGTTAPVLGSTTLFDPYTGETKTYNLDDPTQAESFYNDKMGVLTQMRDEAVGKADKASKRQLADLETQLNDTYAEAQQYVEDYQKTVNEFGDQYSLGNVKRGQFFAGLAPQAYQSSQGTSAKFAEGKYLEGLGDYAQEAQTNVGSDFLGNPSDTGALGGNSIYGRQVGNIKTGQQDVAQAFNEYLTQTQRDVGSQGADISNQLGGINEYGFSTQPIGDVNRRTTDTSAYTPYTTFQQGGQQVPVNQQNPTVYQRNTFNDQTPLESFLGQNKLNQTQKDYLRSYLKA